MTFLSYLAEDSDITDLLFADTARFQGMNDFTHRVLRGKSELSVLERETLAAFVSAENACTYCSGIHSDVAKRFGMRADLMDQLIVNIDTAQIDTALKPIFHFAKKLTHSPSRIVKADVDAIKKAGWSEQTVSDVIHITGLFNFYNRLLDGHGIKGHSKIFSEGSKHLAKRGYRFPAIVAFFFKIFWNKKKKRNN